MLLGTGNKRFKLPRLRWKHQCEGWKDELESRTRPRIGFGIRLQPDLGHVAIIIIPLKERSSPEVNEHHAVALLFLACLLPPPLNLHNRLKSRRLPSSIANSSATAPFCCDLTTTITLSSCCESYTLCRIYFSIRRLYTTSRTQCSRFFHPHTPTQQITRNSWPRQHCPPLPPLGLAHLCGPANHRRLRPHLPAEAGARRGVHTEALLEAVVEAVVLLEAVDGAVEVPAIQEEAHLLAMKVHKQSRWWINRRRNRKRNRSKLQPPL